MHLEGEKRNCRNGGHRRDRQNKRKGRKRKEKAEIERAAIEVKRDRKGGKEKKESWLLNKSQM